MRKSKELRLQIGIPDIAREAKRDDFAMLSMCCVFLWALVTGACWLQAAPLFGEVFLVLGSRVLRTSLVLVLGPRTTVSPTD